MHCDHFFTVCLITDYCKVRARDMLDDDIAFEIGGFLAAIRATNVAPSASNKGSGITARNERLAVQQNGPRPRLKKQAKQESEQGGRTESLREASVFVNINSLLFEFRVALAPIHFMVRLRISSFFTKKRSVENKPVRADLESS